MYSEDDLRAAVESGAISADAANALRSHVAAARQTKNLVVFFNKR